MQIKLPTPKLLAAKLLGCAAVLSVISGCATTQVKEDTLVIGQQYEWQDQNLSTSDIANLSLEEFTVRKKGLHLKVAAEFISDEVQYTAAGHQGANSQQLKDLAQNAAFIRCSTQQHDFDDCLASNNKFGEQGIVRLDEKLTGREHAFSANISSADMLNTWLTVVLNNGELTYEVSLPPSRFTFNVDKQTVYIPLKRIIEQAPFKPEKVNMTVRIAANSDANSPAIESSKTLDLPIERLASLELTAVQWLSKEEQKIVYLQQIKQALLAKEYQLAWDNLNDLKDLGYSMPASFYFRYGQAMHLAGETEQAKKHLRYFVEYVDKLKAQDEASVVDYQVQYKHAKQLLAK